MECPICFTQSANCTFACGHGFCTDCVKHWYIKCGNDTPTCPMCREDIMFPGMHAKIDEWDDERVIHRYTEIFEECLEEALEDWEDIMEPIEIFEIIHDKYSKIINDDESYYEDDMVYFILTNLDTPFRFRLSPVRYYDAPISRKFVSRYPQYSASQYSLPWLPCHTSLGRRNQCMNS